MKDSLLPNLDFLPEDEYEVTLRKFFSVEDADALAAVLMEHGILSVVKRGGVAATDLLWSNFHDKEIGVNIREEDMPRALALMEKLAQQAGDDPESPMNDMTEDELWEVVTHPDQWDEGGVAQAKRILQSKGVELNTFQVKEARKVRTKATAKPDAIAPWRIWSGYLFSFLIPIVGILYGSSLIWHKKTLPDGSRVSGYSKKIRNDGRAMILIAFVTIVLWYLFTLSMAN
jgi:hypothetical protein